MRAARLRRNLFVRGGVDENGVDHWRWRVIMDCFIFFLGISQPVGAISGHQKDYPWVCSMGGCGGTPGQPGAPLRGPHVTRNLSVLGGADWVEIDGVSSWIFF